MVAVGRARSLLAASARSAAGAPAGFRRRASPRAMRARCARQPADRARARLGLAHDAAAVRLALRVRRHRGGHRPRRAGALVMAVFWAGTLPVLAGVGRWRSAPLGPLPRRLPVLTAALLVVLGVADRGRQVPARPRHAAPDRAAAHDQRMTARRRGAREPTTARAPTAACPVPAALARDRTATALVLLRRLPRRVRSSTTAGSTATTPPRAARGRRRRPAAVLRGVRPPRVPRALRARAGRRRCARPSSTSRACTAPRACGWSSACRCWCPASLRAELDVRRALAHVEWDPARPPRSAIARALDTLGYRPHPFRGAAREALRRARGPTRCSRASASPARWRAT